MEQKKESAAGNYQLPIRLMQRSVIRSMMEDEAAEEKCLHHHILHVFQNNKTLCVAHPPEIDVYDTQALQEYAEKHPECIYGSLST